MPPRTLKRPICGGLKESGTPASAEATSGSPQISANASQSMRICAPVRSWRRRAHRRRTMAARTPARNAASTAPKPEANSGRGRNRPRLLRSPPPGSATLPQDFRQRFEHGVVPEQKLQQQRHVADQLDIAGGEPRHQPVARQPRNADGKAEHGREHDADRGDQQRIEEADPERAAEGRGACRIGDQRLADVEAGRIVPEAEAGGDVGAREVMRRVDEGARRRGRRPER